MNVRQSFAVVAIAALSVWLVEPGVAQGQDKYKIRLSTIPLDGSLRATVAGSGSATAVLAGTKLTVTGTFDGLRSPATAARLHRGLMTGVRGAALADLTVSKAIGGTVTGTIDLTPEQVQSLKKGQLYVQIASEKAPEGNLWGWILK